MAHIDISTRGGEEFSRLARRLYAGVHTDLERELKQATRKAARPLSRSVRRGLPTYLPDKYALENLAPGIQLKTQLHPQGVTITAGAVGKVKQRALSAIEGGVLRHPVYGHYARPWVNQKVTSRFFTEPIERGAPFVNQQLLAAMERVAAQIAGG